MKLEDLHKIPSEGKFEYYATECGRVFKKMPNPPRRRQLRNSHIRIEGVWYREILGAPNRDGYLIVNLNSKSQPMHRVVISAFRGTSELTVDHLNAIKTDNRIENLEYVTQAENNRRAGLLGLSNHRPDTHKVMRRLLEETYLTDREIALELGIGYSSVSRFMKRENIKRPLDYSGKHKNRRKPVSEEALRKI